MNKIKILVLSTSLVFSSIHIIAQSTEIAKDLLVAEKLKEDFNLLRSKLETSQPGLYLYISKDSLDMVFDAIAKSIDKPMTAIDFYRKIAILNKFIRNGHTRIWPPDSFDKLIETSLPRFPFDIYIEDGKMLVLNNNSLDERIQPGTIIKSINGELAESIFQKLVDGRFRDGFNKTYPVAQVSRNFSFYYARHIATPLSFKVNLISPDGTIQDVVIQGLTNLEIRKNRQSRFGDKYNRFTEEWDSWIARKEPALLFDIKGDVATMTIRTFYRPIIKENGQDPEYFLFTSFQQIEKTKVNHLIIDLRNNLGGDDLIGMKLISYLYDSSYLFYKRMSSIVEPDMKFVKNGNEYEILGNKNVAQKFKPITPSKNAFKGKVYVLTDGYSFSATGELIGHLKNINRAIFIGEESGGNPVQFAGGATLDVVLPTSKNGITIPLHQIEMNVKQQNNGHGIVPDYIIRPTLVDILASKDLEMEFAFTLIKKSKKAE